MYKKMFIGHILQHTFIFTKYIWYFDNFAIRIAYGIIIKVRDYVMWLCILVSRFNVCFTYFIKTFGFVVCLDYLIIVFIPRNVGLKEALYNLLFHYQCTHLIWLISKHLILKLVKLPNNSSYSKKCWPLKSFENIFVL